MLAPLFLLLGASVAQQADADALTLDQAIAAALDQAPAIELAEAERDAAAARVMQARAGARPNAVLSGTVGAGHLDPQGYFGLAASRVTPRAAQVSIEQPLFSGGRAAAALAQARAGEAVAVAGSAGIRADLAARVAEAYGAVLVAEAQQRLYEALAGLAAELERHAQDRFEAGDAPRTDAAQAHARAAEARAQLAAADGNARLARIRLAALIGRTPGTLAPLPMPPPVPARAERAMLTALAQNPAFNAARASFDAATAAERGARAGRLPVIAAFAEASSVRDQFFPGYRGDGATLGLRMRWQILDGGRARGQIAEASAGVRAARARLAAAHDQLLEAVTAAHAEIESSAAFEQAASEHAQATRDAARNVREEVKVGQKPQIDLLDAEREATTAQVQFMAARTARIVAAYRLNALLGQQ